MKNCLTGFPPSVDIKVSIYEGPYALDRPAMRCPMYRCPPVTILYAHAGAMAQE